MNELNELLIKMNQNIRIISYHKRPTKLIFNNGFALEGYALVTRFKNLLTHELVMTYNKSFFDIRFSKDCDYKTFDYEFGKYSLRYYGKREIEKRIRETGSAFVNRPKEVWNKGKTGLQKGWSLGLNKTNCDIFKEQSIKKMGVNNPMYGVRISEEDRLMRSNIMKDKILNGSFTPNTNNRKTHFDVSYNNKKYRSSWEAAFHCLNPLLKYENLRIQYINDIGETKIYITDFYDDINLKVYEIKPLSLLEESKYKIEGLTKWCSDNNHTYEIISESYFIKHMNAIENSNLTEDVKVKLRKIKLR